MKFLFPIVVLVVALGSYVGAQTMAEQLQQGIYAEETLKNRDEAARIYRQILAAPSVPEAISTEARRRLAVLLLQARPPVAIATTVVPELPARGVVEGNRFRHVPSGVTFQVPTGWDTLPTMPSSDGGDMVRLHDGNRTINVWMIKEATPATELAARVAGAPAEKVRQRHSGYGIPGMPEASTYQIPADTVRPFTVNGRSAIAAVASYVGFRMDPFPPNELHRMSEYMTWVYTPQSRVFFFSRVPAADVPGLQPTFEQIVNSAIVP
jgi:hypothetical protein